MSIDADTDRLRSTIVTLRLIVFALAAGVLGYAVVAFVLMRGGQPQPGGDTGVLTPLAIALAPVALVVSWILPAAMARNARKLMVDRRRAGTSDDARRASYLGAIDPLSFQGVYQTKTIVSAALLEGAGFFAITAYLLEGNSIALVLGVLLALAILAMFPIESRVVDWIRDQERLLNEEQLLVR